MARSKGFYAEAERAFFDRWIATYGDALVDLRTLLNSTSSKTRHYRAATGFNRALAKACGNGVKREWVLRDLLTRAVQGEIEGYHVIRQREGLPAEMWRVWRKVSS